MMKKYIVLGAGILTFIIGLAIASWSTMLIVGSNTSDNPLSHMPGVIIIVGIAIIVVGFIIVLFSKFEK
jgi:hypothetical protein